MKKLFYTATLLFMLSMLISSCGSHEKCPGVGQMESAEFVHHA